MNHKLNKVKIGISLTIILFSINHCIGPLFRPKTTLPALPEQPDRWINAVHIPKGNDVVVIEIDPWYTRLGLPWPSPRPQRKYVSRIKVGESIAGINIGAIKCTYHNIDAGSGRDQYMWRNTWTCIAAEDSRQIEEEHSFDKRIINYPHLIAFRLPTAYLDRNNDRHIADAKPVQEPPTTYNIQQLDDFPMRQQRLLNWQKETILSKEGVQSET